MYIERYDGTLDLDEHLDAFTMQVNLYSNDDAVMCKVFSTSLTEPTLTWYKRLPRDLLIHSQPSPNVSDHNLQLAALITQHP